MQGVLPMDRGYTFVDSKSTFHFGRLFDISLAALLAIPALVAIAPVYVLYVLTIRDGGRFLYRGQRMGKNKQLFTIYKIRTLFDHAERTLGAQMHSANHRMVLWYGDFLRRTRIDELPQLINIINGTMTFIGPRPERKVMYDLLLFSIPGYDRRFSVLPGLTGYSQFLTPHGTPKEIRTRIDNRFIKQEMTAVDKITFVLWTFYRCAYLMGAEALRSAVAGVSLLVRGRTARNRRQVRREKLRLTTGVLNCAAESCSALPENLPCTGVDINHHFILMALPCQLPENEKVKFDLAIKKTVRGSQRTLRVACTGEIKQSRGVTTSLQNKRDGKESIHHIIAYEANTHYSRYLIDKHLLREGIAG